MARNWQLKLIKPERAVEVAVNKAWAMALKDLSGWMMKDLASAMVFGGLGIDGISSKIGRAHV